MSIKIGDAITRYPKHIAIIMDGNGRWAKNRLSPRTYGHRKGVTPIIETLKFCLENKPIKALTLFAFSTENWQRPEGELNQLFSLLVDALHNRIAEIHEQGVRLEVIGNTVQFEKKIQDLLQEAINLTSNNCNLVLTIALNYGGKSDIISAVNKWLKGSNKEKQLTEVDIEKHISLNHLPPLDLLIRTGGELRLSNFLIWQAAYAELYFTDELWPDFNKESLKKALLDYSARERRFGKI